MQYHRVAGKIIREINLLLPLLRKLCMDLSGHDLGKIWTKKKEFEEIKKHLKNIEKGIIKYEGSHDIYQENSYGFCIRQLLNQIDNIKATKDWLSTFFDNDFRFRESSRTVVDHLRYEVENMAYLVSLDAKNIKAIDITGVSPFIMAEGEFGYYLTLQRPEHDLPAAQLKWAFDKNRGKITYYATHGRYDLNFHEFTNPKFEQIEEKGVINILNRSHPKEHYQVLIVRGQPPHSAKPLRATNLHIQSIHEKCPRVNTACSCGNVHSILHHKCRQCGRYVAQGTCNTKQFSIGKGTVEISVMFHPGRAYFGTFEHIRNEFVREALLGTNLDFDEVLKHPEFPKSPKWLVDHFIKFTQLAVFNYFKENSGLISKNNDTFVEVTYTRQEHGILGSYYPSLSGPNIATITIDLPAVFRALARNRKYGYIGNVKHLDSLYHTLKHELAHHLHLPYLKQEERHKVLTQTTISDTGWPLRGTPQQILNKILDIMFSEGLARFHEHAAHKYGMIFRANIVHKFKDYCVNLITSLCQDENPEKKDYNTLAYDFGYYNMFVVFLDFARRTNLKDNVRLVGMDFNYGHNKPGKDKEPLFIPNGKTYPIAGFSSAIFDSNYIGLSSIPSELESFFMQCLKKFSLKHYLRFSDHAFKNLKVHESMHLLTFDMIKQILTEVNAKLNSKVA